MRTSRLWNDPFPNGPAATAQGTLECQEPLDRHRHSQGRQVTARALSKAGVAPASAHAKPPRRKNLAVTSTAGKAAGIIHLLQGLGGAVSPEKGKELLGMEALQGRLLSQGFRRHPECAESFYKHHSNPSGDLGSLQDKTWNGFGGEWEGRCGVGGDGFPQPGTGTIPVVLPSRNLLLMGTNPHPGGHQGCVPEFPGRQSLGRMLTLPCLRLSLTPHPSPQPLPSPLTGGTRKEQRTFGKSLHLWQQCHHLDVYSSSVPTAELQTQTQSCP